MNDRCGELIVAQGTIQPSEMREVHGRRHIDCECSLAQRQIMDSKLRAVESKRQKQTTQQWELTQHGHLRCRRIELIPEISQTGEEEQRRQRRRGANTMCAHAT